MKATNPVWGDAAVPAGSLRGSVVVAFAPNAASIGNSHRYEPNGGSGAASVSRAGFAERSQIPLRSFNSLPDAQAPAWATAEAPIASVQATLETLSLRQRDVLDLIVRGMSNKEIARALKLGEGTVKIHVAALFRKLGVYRRAAAAVAGAWLLSNSTQQRRDSTKACV